MTILFRIAIAAGLALCAAPAPAQTQDALAQAISDTRRPPDQTARDAARKPLEIMRFAGVRPGEKVVDYMSGGAYFTRLFSVAVGPEGRVYAVIPEEMARLCAPEEFAGAHVVEHDPSYQNVAVSIQRANELSAPEPVDLVFTSLNYHDLHDHYFEGEKVSDVNRRIFAALKPGGVYLIIDHAAEPGSGLRDTESRHRIDPAQIRKEVEAAGFVFEAQSDVLRNLADDYSVRVFDPKVRGHTDQVVLKFRKPAWSVTALSGYWSRRPSRSQFKH
jgi:predicted methyltransferase